VQQHLITLNYFTYKINDFTFLLYIYKISLNIYITMYIQKLVHTLQGKLAFSVRHDVKPQHHNIWHYHDELEFIHIKDGNGTFFVGDCIQKFSSGDIVLIGSKTPHYWLFDEEYIQEKHAVDADIRVIHFKPDFCGQEFLNLDEATAIRSVYEMAKRGMLLPRQDTHLQSFFENIMVQQSIKRVTLLLEALEYIDQLHEACLLLASPDYVNPQHHDDYLRMNKVLEYVRLHYRSQIFLQEIAQLAGMTPNSFCRYFKQKTGKTFIQFVQELRIAHACKLLKRQELSIKEVCFECGYQNFVSFHKNFKHIMGKSPNAYRLDRIGGF